MIRKGSPKPSTGNKPGADLDELLRFVGANEEIHADWKQTFGNDKFPALNIRFAFNDGDAVWSAWREHWVAGGLVYRCDGKQHVMWRGSDGNLHHDPRPCPGESCEAKPVGRLWVLVPEWGRLGMVLVTTTSINDILAIGGLVSALRLELAGTRVPLRAIPMVLSRSKRKISTPESVRDADGSYHRTGKRLRREKWLLHLEPDTEWTRAFLLGSNMLPASTFAALPAPADPPDVDALSDPTDEPEWSIELGWTERIGACQNTRQVDALLLDILQIEQQQHRENAVRLAHRKIADLILAFLSHDDGRGFDPDAEGAEAVLVSARAKLEALPEDIAAAALAKLAEWERAGEAAKTLEGE